MSSGASEIYTGLRILEAMHEAVRYSAAIFQELRRARPTLTTRQLDFGAGDGMFIRKFREHDIKVDAVEPDPALQAGLRSHGASVYSSTNEIRDASYDFIYTINTLEHISNLNECCAEIFRILQPSGKLFIFVPAFELLWTNLDTEVGHVRRFTRKSLLNALQNAGFVVNRMNYFDSLGFPAALGVRVLERVGLFRYGGGTIGMYDRYIFPISHALDRVFGHVVGKNLIAIAERPN